jgi:hypothetical protein
MKINEHNKTVMVGSAHPTNDYLESAVTKDPVLCFQKFGSLSRSMAWVSTPLNPQMRDSGNLKPDH